VSGISSFTALARSQENLVVHSALNDEETGCDETFFEKLSLEHFNEMLNSELLG
jgi:hypothetical protein